MHDKLLGEIQFSTKQFSGIDAVFKRFTTAEFKHQTAHSQIEEVNRSLLHCIQAEPEPCFLFSAVLSFIDRICQEKILEEYAFKQFEFWLNQKSGISFEENYRVRAKIVGKLVDRSDYQAFFPIGAGKIFDGTHYVTAHRSPDLDTTVASFWGWLDAFAARVGNGLHIWNVPGGPPAQFEIDWLFNEFFGPAIFTRLAKTHSTLNATGLDLMKQNGMQYKRPFESIIGIDHDQDQSAVVVVDEEGFYVGEWHSTDVESVRDLILLFSSCLRWFENALQLHLMSFFGQGRVKKQEAIEGVQELFQMVIGVSEPALEFTQKQKQKMQKFLTRVLGIEQGLECPFELLIKHLSKLARYPLEETQTFLSSMPLQELFNAKGELIEDRSKIFGFLEKSLHALHEAILHIRKRLECLDIALHTKKEVLGIHNVWVQSHADIEEVKSKIGQSSFLTVVAEGHKGMFPVGAIHASSIHKPILGTVSLRDFCNREEMGIPSYLEVISVIDHHRTTLNTSAPPFAIISDAQSSNTLVAKQEFLVNDRNSLLGQTLQGIEKQLAEHLKDSGPVSTRMAQNLLQRRMIAQKKSKFFIHPDREYLEYLHFIYAIIDDTDLLTKVTVTDVECVAELLNRMKSIAQGRICEIISLDDLPRNRSFAKKGAARILQNADMYSLYRKVYDLRAVEIEKNLALAAKGSPSNIFADTKEQNGCCRIGQTKLFATNIPTFAKFATNIREVWQKNAEKIAHEKAEIALHLHMVSTVVDAKQVYQGSEPTYTHKDELWIWIPKDPYAGELLKRFLNLLLASPGLKNQPLEVEIMGEKAESLSRMFKEVNEAILPKVSRTEAPTIAIIRFAPGLLNSRKSMVTPFLPKS